MSEKPDIAILERTGKFDMGTFKQILEMDDDDAQEFSRSIVFDFFEQATSTFDKMDAALEEKDLKELSALGHFLKGSSAALGLHKISESCEKIQNFGARKDATGNVPEPDDKKSLERLEDQIDVTKEEYSVVESALRSFYGE